MASKRFLLSALLALSACALTAHGTGISWPAGQIFPHFAALTSLDIVDISGMTFDNKVLFTTLQGLVNRTSPRIFLLDAQRSGEGKTFWMDRIDIAKNSIADPFSLLIKYKTEVNGICIYDPAVMGTVDVAVTAAGLNGGVVVSPTLAGVLAAAPYGFRTLIDLRGNQFANDRAAFRWAVINLWPQCSHRLLAGLKPDTHYPLMDYMVANRAMCLWLDPGVADDKALLDSVFTSMTLNSAYLGWWPGESPGVAYASKYSVITFASDWFQNATVFGTSTHTVTNLPEVAAPPPLANKCYVAMILSDGDNLQEQEHFFPIRWKSPLRGTFPVSWTQAPSLTDFAPAILNYYYSTRTPNDCFITGPSGAGYVYPGNWDHTKFIQFAQLTNTYLVKSGIHTATIWGTTDWASDLYGQYCPNLLGMATFGDPLGVHKWKNALPSLDMLPTYASLASQITDGQDGITGKLAAWNRAGPMFIAPQLNANAAGLAELQKVYDMFKTDSNVVFVRADQLFQLIKLAGPVTGNLREARPRAGAVSPDILEFDGNGRLVHRSQPSEFHPGRVEFKLGRDTH